MKTVVVAVALSLLALGFITGHSRSASLKTHEVVKVETSAFKLVTRAAAISATVEVF